MNQIFGIPPQEAPVASASSGATKAENPGGSVVAQEQAPGTAAFPPLASEPSMVSKEDSNAIRTRQRQALEAEFRQEESL